MSSATTLTIDRYSLPKMRYDEIEPGDLICSFEQIITRTDLLGLKFLLDLSSFGAKCDLNRLFHAQIILHKYPRDGVFQIAHADGSIRKVVMQDDWFKEHNPCQALVVFRAKSLFLQKEIVQVAKTTAKKGNHHFCKTVEHRTIFDRLKFLFDVSTFQHFEQKASAATLKNLSQMAVHFSERGCFHAQDKTSTMSCIEYVVNVVCISYLMRYAKYCFSEKLTREEKIEKIFHHLLKINQTGLLPVSLSNPRAMPASFGDFFLNETTFFKPMGYLGVVSNRIEGPPLEVPAHLKSSPLTLSSEKELKLEKEQIKQSQLTRSEKTLALSLNALNYQKLKNEQMRLFALNFFSPLKGLSPIHKITNFFMSIFAKKGAEIAKTKTQLLTLHEKVRKNGRFYLNDSEIPYGHKIWLHYSTDGGISFDVEPFSLNNHCFVASIVLPSQRGIIYRIFIGPENENDLDPISKAQGWDRIVDQPEYSFPFQWNRIHYNQMALFIENQQSTLKIVHRKTIDWTLLPRWKPRSNAIETYFQKCNEIAPTRNTPEEIQQYDTQFAHLERTFPPLFPVQPDIEHAVLTFSEKKWGLLLKKNNIQLLKQGLGSGLSGDPLYRIVNGQGQPIGVVKVFLQSRGKCAREFHALTNHNKLSLQSLNLPQVQGIASAQIENKTIYFLGLEHIAGVSVYDQFTKLAECKPDSLERAALFSLLKRAYQKLGTAIAEFHLAAKTLEQPVHPAFLNMIELFHTHALKKVSAHLEQSVIDAAQNFFNSSLQKIKGKIFPKGYVHGDLNLGNILMNYVTDQLTILDWPDGSLSVGKDGVPTGISFWDVLQIKQELLTSHPLGVSLEETDELFQVFSEEYQKNVHYSLDYETGIFFTYLMTLGSIKWFLDKKAMFNESQLEIAESIFRIKKMLLNDFVSIFD